MTRVTIDLNVRLAHNLTFAGYEDIHGAVPEVGECVWAWEEESNLYARAIVVEIKPEIGLIYLAVAWGEFHQPFQLSVAS
jgi:hypothetical protein